MDWICDRKATRSLLDHFQSFVGVDVLIRFKFGLFQSIFVNDGGEGLVGDKTANVIVDEGQR